MGDRAYFLHAARLLLAISQKYSPSVLSSDTSGAFALAAGEALVPPPPAPPLALLEPPTVTAEFICGANGAACQQNRRYPRAIYKHGIRGSACASAAVHTH